MTAPDLVNGALEVAAVACVFVFLGICLWLVMDACYRFWAPKMSNGPACHPDAFWVPAEHSHGPTIGVCSKCGMVRTELGGV